MSNKDLNNSDLYSKRDCGSRDKCSVCGKEKVVYVYTSLLTGKSLARVDECECETALRLEEEKMQQKAAQVTFSKKCDKFFPFLESDPNIREHIFENFEINPQNEKAFKEAKKTCLSYWGGYGVNFVGKYGSGKTRLALTILYERYLKGDDCIFVKYARIFDRVFATIEKDSKESKKDLLDCLCNVKHLVIDELGVGNNSPAKEDLFLLILEERKRKGLCTHFTMNPEGEQNLGGRILSRLNEFALPVINNADDYRLKAGKKQHEKIRKANAELLEAAGA